MISKTGFLILGLLQEGPLSGYMIRKLTLARFRFFWSESFGQIYPQLKRLAAEGLIQAEALPTKKQGRRQAAFILTEKGKETLRQWLSDTESHDSLRLESILKIYTAAISGGNSCSANLEAFALRTSRALAELEAMKAGLAQAADPENNHQRIIALMDVGITTYRAWLAWASQADILAQTKES